MRLRHPICASNAESPLRESAQGWRARALRSHPDLMRAMWSGSLAFGLVNVPVKMYAATEDHSVRFHQVHLADGGRIKLKRVCSVDGEEVPYGDIGKGYEDPSGQRLVFGPDDFEGLPVGPKKEIEVLEFVPAPQVDPVLFDKTYYLEPDGRALKPYVLLREALQSTDRMAIVKIAIRQRTQLASLRVRDGVLVLQTMLWPDEVRAADFGFLSQEVDIRPQELQMAQSLIGNLSSDFDPSQYTDTYREAILRLIDARLAGGDGLSPPAEDSGPDQVVDLMEALRASVERTSKSAAEPAGEQGAAKAPAQRSRARRSAKTA